MDYSLSISMSRSRMGSLQSSEPSMTPLLPSTRWSNRLFLYDNIKTLPAKYREISVKSRARVTAGKSSSLSEFCPPPQNVPSYSSQIVGFCFLEKSRQFLKFFLNFPCATFKLQVTSFYQMVDTPIDYITLNHGQ